LRICIKKCAQRLSLDVRGGSSLLKFAPAFDRLKHGHLVGVLNVAANGNSSGDARDAQPAAAKLAGEMERSRSVDETVRQVRD